VLQVPNIHNGYLLVWKVPLSTPLPEEEQREDTGASPVLPLQLTEKKENGKGVVCGIEHLYSNQKALN